MMMVYPRLFAENNSFTTVITKKYLEKYRNYIIWKNKPSIMEIGHGDGGNSKSSLFPVLPEDLKEFIATDKSAKMIEYAEKNSVRPLMKFKELDIETKYIPTEYLNRFDHIFGFFVMHMVKDPRQAFLNMHKMLKNDGSIFLNILEHTTIDEPMDKMLKIPEWKNFGLENSISPYYYSPNPRQEWERNLYETGFRNYEFFEDNGVYEFEDEEFDKFVLSVSVVLPTIPDHKLEYFKQIFRELTRKGEKVHIQQRNGKEIVSFDYKLFTISARKS
nr:juvenile hormone acid O-methyltransferase-like [Leptinotarsa decemlineata]